MIDCQNCEDYQSCPFRKDEISVMGCTYLKNKPMHCHKCNKPLEVYATDKSGKRMWKCDKCQLTMQDN